jgi:hypothetical protein
MTTRRPMNLHCLGAIVHAHREAYRLAPEVIEGTLAVVREMITARASQGCPDWITDGALDCVIGSAQLAARGLAEMVYDHIGEDDSDLGEVQP